MTDDTRTTPIAEDPRIEALARASRTIEVAPLDVARVVRAARTRRRRTIIGGALAAAVIVAVSSVATAGNQPSPAPDADAADRSSTPLEGLGLTVTVDTLDSLTGELALRYVRQRYHSRTDPMLTGDAARWDPDDEILTYVPRTRYTTCLPEGVATRNEASIDLSLTVPGDACRTVAQPVLVTINGLTDPPAELTVREAGQSHTVPVEQDQHREAHDLTVVVKSLGYDNRGTPTGVARWDGTTGTATYRPSAPYSCRIDVSASRRGSTVSLTVTESDGGCGAVPEQMSITIAGLDVAPDEIVVIEAGRKTTVPVD